MWVVTRRQGPPVPRSPLLNALDQLLPKPAAIFEQWFRDFQVGIGRSGEVGIYFIV